MWSPRERAAAFVDWVEHLLEVLAHDGFPPETRDPADDRRTRQDHPRPRSALRRIGGTRSAGSGSRPKRRSVAAREDNALLDEFCDETGRTVLRSALIGYSFVGETPFQSDEAYADVVGRYAEAGFEEMVFYYPPEWGMPAGSVAHGVFERAFAAP